MSRVYSVRLAAGTQVAGLDAVVYTCPAGRVAVLRDMALLPLGGPPSLVALYIGAAATVHSVAGGAALISLQWQGRTVLSAGEQLRLNTLTGSWQYCISGYELVA